MVSSGRCSVRHTRRMTNMRGCCARRSRSRAGSGVSESRTTGGPCGHGHTPKSSTRRTGLPRRRAGCCMNPTRSARSSLTASFYAPHPPLIPPRFYFDRYMRLELPPPAVGAWRRAPPKTMDAARGIDATRTVLRGEALRCVQAGYYGLINHIDDTIYWLIHEFKERSGKARRPWLVVFTSDHGEMLGDHYYYRKCEPYEGSTRIPMMIEGSPDLGFRYGQVLAQPVCLEDLMPDAA